MDADGATIPRTMSIARRISVSEASSVRKAAWEVSVTFSVRASGWSGLSGSAWKTSSPAWRTWPLASASRRAASSTSAPQRGVDEDHAPLGARKALGVDEAARVLVEGKMQRDHVGARQQ